MSIRNPEWYALNETRDWPFDDLYSIIDDDGERLPSDILADMMLRFPESLGTTARISGITVSPNIVTLVIISNTGKPLASFHAETPVTTGRCYALSPMADGVGGWIVLGSGVNDHKNTTAWRFNTQHRAVLSHRAAWRYAPIPVKSLSRCGSDTEMVGDIFLKGGDDVAITKEVRQLPGLYRLDGSTDWDVIVIKLKDKTGVGEGANVLDKYRGPCGGRAESRTCGPPHPIENFNVVPPDCCGNIFIEFRGFITITATQFANTALLDTGLGLGEACVTPDHLPDIDGNLPNEYDDKCSSDIAERELVEVCDVQVPETLDLFVWGEECPKWDGVSAKLNYNVSTGNWAGTAIDNEDESHVISFSCVSASSHTFKLSIGATAGDPGYLDTIDPNDDFAFVVFNKDAQQGMGCGYNKDINALVI